MLTDGKQWQFFYPFGQGDYDDRRVCVLDLSDSDSKENANVLQRYLSYPSVQNKEAVQTIESDYRLLSSQRDAEKHLPQAWQRLLEGTDSRGDWLIELVEGATESLCGHKPSKEQVLDFLTNLRSAPVSREDALPPSSPRPSPRSPIRLTFIVTMPDGERIERDTIRATFVAVIEKLGEQFGMDRLVDLSIERYSTPIIATSKYRQFQQSQSGLHYILANQTEEDEKRDLKFWQIQSGSHYILVNQMTRDKERDLKKIAEGLGIELEIECRPKENDWVRGVSQDTQRAANQELSETEQLMRKFWTGLQEYMNDKGSSVNCPAPTTRNYLQFSIGRTTFTLQAWVASTNREIGIRLYMAGDFSKAHYYLLKEQQEEIHNEFGETLDWHALPENERSRISLSKADTDSLDENDWPHQYEWFTTQLELFDKVFRERIKGLNAADWMPEDDAP